MTGTEIPRVSVKNPRELLAAVPYLMGFTPEESVVVILLHPTDKGSLRVRLAARSDLEHAGDLPTSLAPHLGPVGSQAMVVVYTDSDPQWAVDEYLSGYDEALVIKDLLVTDGRLFWTTTCTEGCCSPLDGPGTPVLADDSHVAAEMIYAGISKVPTRDDLLASVQPGPASRHAAHEAALSSLYGSTDEWPEVLANLVQHHADSGTRPDADQVATLTALVSTTLGRDAAMFLQERDNAQAHAALWSYVVQNSAPADVAGPLALYATATFLAGNGAGLNLAVESLQRWHPGYSMTALLAAASAAAMPPEVFERLLAEAASQSQSEGS